MMRILHVVATRELRGAEVFASDLVGALGESVIQQVFVLRDGETRNWGRALSVDALRTVPTLRLGLEPLRALAGTINAWQPDVIQAHGGEPFKYAVCVSGRRPIVYRRIGLAPPWILAGPRRLAYRLLLRRATVIQTVADVVRTETIERFGVPPSRVVTIPNGVDRLRVEPQIDRDTVRSRLGIPVEARVILSVGALTWEKAPFEHLRATRAVRSDDDAVFHVFAGDGDLRRDLEDLIAHEKEGGTRVRVVGRWSGIGDLLNASDVLLFASREDGMEGMPAVVIEAGMAALPVVAYAVAGVSEVVADQVTGRLVRPGDIETLSECIDELLADGALRRRMGAAARDRCQANFDIYAVASRYLDVYREAARFQDLTTRL